MARGPALCRPYNQGARLTAFELVAEGMPATLIVDSAAAALLASGRVDAVVVGADRVVANGDTANKIGTRMLAVVARAAGVPFFVAAPTTSIDPATAGGAAIEIEERGADEVTCAAGGKGARVAAEGIEVWNPAFDVADAADITGVCFPCPLWSPCWCAASLDCSCLTTAWGEGHAGGAGCVLHGWRDADLRHQFVIEFQLSRRAGRARAAVFQQQAQPM